MTMGRVAGWALAAGAFLSAASWGWYERSTRSKVEDDRERAYDRLTQTIQSLADTEKRRDAFETELGKVRTDQEDLSRRFVDTQLRHRSNEDTWLSEKVSLQVRIEQLEKKQRRLETDLLAEKESSTKEQSRRTQTEAQLAAEQDASREAANRWRQERAEAETQVRRLAADLKRANDANQTLQGDLTKTQGLWQRSQDAVRQLESDLGKTLNERDAAAVASQQTGAALNQAVVDLQRRETDMVSLQSATAQLSHALNNERRESQQLQHSNKALTGQVQQLSAQNRQLSTQNQQLAVQIQQLQAQIRSLNEQLAALRVQNRPPVPHAP